MLIISLLYMIDPGRGGGALRKGMMFSEVTCFQMKQDCLENFEVLHTVSLLESTPGHLNQDFKFIDDGKITPSSHLNV